MALAIDGQASSLNSASTQVVATLTTGAHELIVAYVFDCGTNAQGSAQQVTTVTDDQLSMTWTRQSRQNFHSAVTGTPYINIEVWYAYNNSATALSSDVIRANFASAFDAAALIAFGVSGTGTTGSSPPFFEAQGTGLATANTGAGSGSSAPSISAVSTTYDKTLLVMGAVCANTAGDPADQTAGSSFTLLRNQDNASAVNWLKGAVEYQTTESAAPESALTTAFGGSWLGWIAATEAIVDASAVVPAGATVTLMGAICL